MAESKASFILYADMIHMVSKLTDEKAGKLFKHILDYVNDKDPQTDDFIIEIAFEPIKQQLKRDLKDWEKRKELRQKAGQLGGINSGKSRSSKQSEANEASASKTKQTKQSQANEAVNVNVNGNGNVNGNVNVVVDESTTKGNSSTSTPPPLEVIVTNHQPPAQTYQPPATSYQSMSTAEHLLPKPIPECRRIYQTNALAVEAFKRKNGLSAGANINPILDYFDAHVQSEGTTEKTVYDYGKHLSAWAGKRGRDAIVKIIQDHAAKSIKQESSEDFLKRYS